MLIDFCDSDLVTNISSSGCECEGYGVKNLISKVEQERNKGFLAEYFIKPPVTVELEFLCDILLSHVILWSRVGSQKTVGVELLTQASEDSVYNSVGRAFMQNELVGFLFCKHGDRTVKLVDSDKFLVHSFKNLRLRTRSVQIKILKTLGSSVPALQRVEIWGKICRDCPKKTLEIVLKTCNNAKNSKLPHFNGTKEQITIQRSVEKTSSSHCSAGSSAQFEMPDEFFDPISCEVMTTPMIMPSGKIIDNSTLERYKEEEAKWGRFPSDPFTGIFFTEKSRPKICVALKTRIDKFLLDNCDKFYCKSLPRAVGCSNSTNLSLVSSLVSNSGVKISEPLTSVVESQILKRNCDDRPSCSSTKVTEFDKRRKFSCNKDNEKLDKVTESNKSIPEKVLDNTRKPTTHTNNFTLGLQKYDEMKEKSLDWLLKTTLSSLPSFTKSTISENYTVLCFKCSSITVLYELPCKHHVCRLCLSALIETDILVCMVCSAGFNTGDPKRIHLMNI